MKTKTELHLMSDVELISTLCELRGYTIGHYVFQGIITINKGKKTTTFEMTYNDIMPIVYEYGISLIKVDDGYVACKYDLYIDIGSYEDIEGICTDGIQIGDKNLLRAATMCLILVLQGKAE